MKAAKHDNLTNPKNINRIRMDALLMFYICFFFDVFYMKSPGPGGGAAQGSTAWGAAGFVSFASFASFVSFVSSVTAFSNFGGGATATGASPFSLSPCDCQASSPSRAAGGGKQSPGATNDEMMTKC